MDIWVECKCMIVKSILRVIKSSIKGSRSNFSDLTIFPGSPILTDTLRIPFAEITLHFFGIGSSKIVTIEKNVRDGGIVPTPHGLINRPGNRSLNDETAASLNLYFDNLKAEAKPHASKVV